MGLMMELKEVRQQGYLSQQDFAEEIGVSFSTINRWENGKAIPNYQAMKRLIEYCKRLNIDYANMENEWKKVKNSNPKK